MKKGQRERQRRAWKRQGLTSAKKELPVWCQPGPEQEKVLRRAEEIKSRENNRQKLPLEDRICLQRAAVVGLVEREAAMRRQWREANELVGLGLEGLAAQFIRKALEKSACSLCGQEEASGSLKMLSANRTHIVAKGQKISNFWPQVAALEPADIRRGFVCQGCESAVLELLGDLPEGHDNDRRLHRVGTLEEPGRFITDWARTRARVLIASAEKKKRELDSPLDGIARRLRQEREDLEAREREMEKLLSKKTEIAQLFNLPLSGQQSRGMAVNG